MPLDKDELKLLGALDERTANILNNQERQTKDIGRIFERLDQLPCQEHKSKIDSLCEWQKGSKDLNSIDRTGAQNRKTALVGGGASAGFVFLFELVKWLITGRW